MKLASFHIQLLKNDYLGFYDIHNVVIEINLKLGHHNAQIYNV